VSNNSAYVDKRDGSRYTGISIRSLDYAREKGDLPYYRVGRKVLFRIDDLDAWMERFRVDPTELDAADAH
jgi:excisionase family DNA binding protein